MPSGCGPRPPLGADLTDSRLYKTKNILCRVRPCRAATVGAVAQGPERGPEGLDEAFGRVLREVRKSKGLSQEALGTAGNLHPTYVSLLERGKNSPSLRALFVLADGLGVKPSELVERTERAVRDSSTG